MAKSRLIFFSQNLFDRECEGILIIAVNSLDRNYDVFNRASGIGRATRALDL